ncbi:hypothetical protein FZC84_00340 [Rossellomorea vietnamensis]|uniref:Uncharacterized protein n=1 Tax=Rossellomorea vietnamensis TaxID=218284 RepID=A0A5D4MIJ2_9BACI|nr:hypothetical protein [Rossellomorea vietnamensis]TYS01154.1 hypothetical protein FZC84_00340 [Rossellomorea vietnamensis]
MKKFWTIIITNAICMLLASCSNSEGQTEENVQAEKNYSAVQSLTTSKTSYGTRVDITVGGSDLSCSSSESL